MRETLTRSLSGLVYIFLLIGATLYSVESFLLLFGVFLTACTSEFCNLVNLKKPLPIAIALIGYALFAFFNNFESANNLLLTIATLFVSFQLIYFLFSNKRQHLDTQSKYVYLIGYIVLPFIIIAKLPFEQNTFAPKILIGIFLIIWANDTFAYVVGKTMGKRKLYEKISPKKTVEGFLGGLVFALIFSYFIAIYLVEQPILHWIIISLICSLFGTIGDLIESKFKRNAGVKDSGKIMPGHGGILDRLDSIIFVSPFIFLFYQILNYV